jgi:TRAP-type uncharacterized transport system substrate-binding protein
VHRRARCRPPAARAERRYPVALALLAANGIDGETARLLPLTGGNAVRALRQRDVDVVFLIAAPGSPTVTEMLATPGVGLLSFPRADAYAKGFPFLSKLVLPVGALSLKADLPPRDTVLLAPAATLVVRADFHPALIDLVLAAASTGGACSRRPGSFRRPTISSSRS